MLKTMLTKTMARRSGASTMLLRGLATRTAGVTARVMTRPLSSLSSSSPQSKWTSVAAMARIHPKRRQQQQMRWASTGSEEASKSEAEKEESQKNGEESGEEQSEVEQLRARVAELEQKLVDTEKEMKDQLLRAYAEAENTRRIADQNIERAKDFSLSSFSKELLTVADTLAMATESVEKMADTAGDDATFKTMLEGLQMTDKVLHDVFARFNVVKIEDVDKFDPELHESLYAMEDPEKETGDIAAVIKPGYKLKDRVIRATQVGTVRNPKKEE